MSRRLPEPLLERLHLGELPADEQERLRAALTPADRARLAELAADDAAILLTHPPARIAAEVRRRLGGDRRRRALWLAAPGVAVAAAALAFAILARPEPPVAAVEGPAEHVTAKGDPRLLVFRRTAAGSEPLLPGAAVAPGEELRLGWLVDAPVRGAIVSLDGRGVVTPHWPSAGAATLQRGRVLLDHAYALDDAPDFERFVLVVGPEADLDSAVRAARAVAGAPDAATRPLPLPPGCTQTDVLIRKSATKRGAP